MSDGTNMICPGCGAFQPRAEVCKKCGIIIAKASQVAKSSVQPAAKAEAGKPPVVMIILAAVIAVPVIGYFLFSGAKTADSPTAVEESAEPEQAGARSQIDRIATVNPAVANNLQQSQVQSKLHTLRTMLNVYLVENDQPPGNEEGLQAMVDKGVVSVPDITDEWGNRFEYRLEWGKETTLEREYKIYLFSKGPDGVSGTADDIGN